MLNISKRCIECHQIKFMSDFYLKRGMPDDHDSRCKQCNYNKHYSVKKRIQAMEIIAKNKSRDVKCWYLDSLIVDKRIIQIHHVNGGGREEGSSNSLSRKICNNLRDTSDLELRCANHNILAEYEDGVRAINGAKFQRRLRAMYAISQNNKVLFKCEECPEKDSRVITINHKNGGGSNELYGGGHDYFYVKIAKGTRDTSDLNLLCYNCQIIYEYKIKRLENTWYN